MNERDGQKERVTEGDRKPEVELDDEQRQKLERIVHENTASSKIAEAILKRDGLN